MYAAAPPAGVDSSDAAHKEQASANGDPSADGTADAKTEAAGTEADGSDSKTGVDEAKTDQAGSPKESTDGEISACSVVIYGLQLTSWKIWDSGWSVSEI